MEVNPSNHRMLTEYSLNQTCIPLNYFLEAILMIKKRKNEVQMNIVGPNKIPGI